MGDGSQQSFPEPKGDSSLKATKNRLKFTSAGFHFFPNYIHVHTYNIKNSEAGLLTVDQSEGAHLELLHLNLCQCSR